MPTVADVFRRYGPAYLERFGFIPSPKTVRTDEATLRR